MRGFDSTRERVASHPTPATSPAATEEGAEQVPSEFLAFRLAEDSYALPVERVREIVRLRPITPVPRLPEAILGALALRGEIVQVVDLRIRLGLAQQEPNRSSRLIILHGDDDRVAALLVDAVAEVLRVSDENLRPSQGSSSGYVRELAVRGTDFVSIIDVERVLDLDAH
jgi:purine-binding chemotaxis protein CheW